MNSSTSVLVEESHGRVIPISEQAADIFRQQTEHHKGVWTAMFAGRASLLGAEADTVG